MKIYLKTWNQFSKNSGLFKTRLELQLIATAFSIGELHYVGRNTEVGISDVISRNASRAVSALAIQPMSDDLVFHRIVQTANILARQIDYFNLGEMPEVIGYDMDLDEPLFNYILSFASNVFRLPYSHQIVFRDLRSELRQLSAIIPDEVYADLEGPFELLIPNPCEDEKIKMIQSHVDYPVLWNANDLGEWPVFLGKLDFFLTEQNKIYGSGHE